MSEVFDKVAHAYLEVAHTARALGIGTLICPEVVSLEELDVFDLTEAVGLNQAQARAQTSVFNRFLKTWDPQALTTPPRSAAHAVVAKPVVVANLPRLDNKRRSSIEVVPYVSSGKKIGLLFQVGGSRRARPRDLGRFEVRPRPDDSSYKAKDARQLGAAWQRENSLFQNTQVFKVALREVMAVAGVELPPI